MSQMRNKLTSRYGAIAVAALLSLASFTIEAQSRNSVKGQVVGEDGEGLRGVGLVLTPLGDTAGAPKTIESGRGGKFNFGFLPSGGYSLDVADPDEHFIKTVAVEIRDVSNLLLKEYDYDVHPEQGLTPFPIQGSQTTNVTLTVVGASYRDQLLLQVEGGRLSGDFDQLVQLYNAGEMEQARELGLKLLDSSQSEIPQVMYLVGMTHRALDQFDEAETLLRRVVELQPENAEAKAGLGTTLLERARAKAAMEEDARAEFVEAEEWLSLAVTESDPVPPALLVNQAIALEGAGQPEAAIEVMERVLSETPDNLTVRFRMASLLRQMGRPERALEILEEIGESTDPRAVDSLYNIAISLYNENDFDSALVALNKAIEINPDDARIQRLMGRTLYTSGELAAAIPHLERFLELDPDHPEADLEREMIDYLRKAARE